MTQSAIYQRAPSSKNIVPRRRSDAASNCDDSKDEKKVPAELRLTAFDGLLYLETRASERNPEDCDVL
jgi:hypothetical protein